MKNKTFVAIEALLLAMTIGWFVVATAGYCYGGSPEAVQQATYNAIETDLAGLAMLLFRARGLI